MVSYKNGKVFTKLSKANIKEFRKELRQLIKKGVALPTEKLIYALNEKLIGWTNYYRCVVSSKVFSRIDEEVFYALKKWGFKRHPRKGKR
jgi:RNA-directed DNA polymerase